MKIVSTLLTTAFLLLTSTIFAQQITLDEPYLLTDQTPDDYQVSSGRFVYQAYRDGNRLFFTRSTDAGQTFSDPQVFTAPDYIGVHALAASENYVYLAYRHRWSRVGTYSPLPVIYKSTNYGESFVRVLPHGLPPTFEVQYNFINPLELFVRGEQVIFALATCVGDDNCNVIRAHVYLLYSFDAGSNWTLQNVSSPDNGMIQLLKMQPAENGLYVFYETFPPRQTFVRYAEPRLLGNSP